MKKSRIAKFALLGASAAALAATLSTSTYAWYVSNKQANVNGGTGATGSAGSDGSVLVSWTGDADTYYKEIAWADDSDKIANDLSPVSFDGTGWYGITTTGTKPADAYTVTPGSGNIPAIRFDVWVKTGNGATVTPTLTITTTKQNANNGQIAYVATGLPTAKLTSAGVVDATSGTVPSMGSTFLVDAKYALYAQQIVTGVATPSYLAVDGTDLGGSAHSYYTAVTSNTPWVVAPQTAAGLDTIATTANTGVKVTYTIYLDGGDLQCFNSCAGWNIAFNLQFSIA